MSTLPGFVVERWTRLSAGTSVIVAVGLAVLAFGPLLFDANIVDRFTTLFIYVILAVRQLRHHPHADRELAATQTQHQQRNRQ